MPGVKDSVQRKIDNFILSAAVGETGYNSIEELTDSLVENYKTIRKEIPEMRVGYGLERNIKVETDTLGIFTMEFLNIHFSAVHIQIQVQHIQILILPTEKR
jgi:hypothetical protein